MVTVSTQRQIKIAWILLDVQKGFCDIIGLSGLKGILENDWNKILDQ